METVAAGVRCIAGDPVETDSCLQALFLAMCYETTALKGLLAVDPESEPVDADSELRHDAE
jgi:hypothetical protein